MFRTALGALGALGIVASAAQAQTLDQPVLPQSDVNCDFSAQPNANPAYCGGTVDGTRSGVLVAPAVTANGRTTATYRVDFAGNLQVDGVRLQGNGAFDASLLTDPGAVQINVNTRYLGTLDVAAAQFNAARLPDYFSRYQTQSLVTNSIGVNLVGASATDAATGQEYTFNLRSVNPANVVNNSTAITGNYTNAGDDSGSALVFGRLTGTADVLQNGVTSPSFTSPNGYFSPFGVAFNVVAQETTRLDENGLATPRIAVTDGINMNGSRVSNLGDGVAAGDAVNRGQLDAEAGARAAADTALAAQVAGEAATRAAADVALGTRVDGEAQTRAAADVALNTRVDTEAQARAAADTALGDRVSGEMQARVVADIALGGRIDAEAATRAAAVAQAAQNVTAERDARVAADTALGTALSSETSARMAADIGLANGLSSLRSDVGNLSFKLEQLDRRVSSGTAVAVAMGGGVFLPGKTFNVTMNVATYDGAHAGSLQVGMLVGPNVAVNGGIATGFNRSGKTAGRAGVSFGF